MPKGVLYAVIILARKSRTIKKSTLINVIRLLKFLGGKTIGRRKNNTSSPY